MSAIQEGRPVPDFQAQATGSQTVRLSDLKGKNVILYFYPKDHTPGCTQEGQDFRDHFEAIQALDAVVFGISRDSLKTHENFKAKQGLPFELIADPEEKLCNLFEVIKWKNMYGKKVRGIERSTFLIDKQGRLAAQWRKASVQGHSEEVLEKLRETESSSEKQS